MVSTVSDEVGEILERIGPWSASDRLNLARRILGTLERDFVESPPAQKPQSKLVGIFKIDGPPPTDEDIRRILEEELMRKHLR